MHTNFHRGWGGQSNRILRESLGLAARGHEVVLAVPAGSVLAERARAGGLEVFDRVNFARGVRPAKLLADRRAIRDFVNARKFEIVHTHGSQDSWAVAFALAGVKPRPIVLRTKHNVFPIRDHAFNRWLYGRATDGVVCISEAILEYCAAKPYLKRENLALIHSAVDAEKFRTADRSLRAEWGVEDRFVIGVTGRLREEKGHKYLIEAMTQVAREAPNAILMIVGSGSLESELREQVRRLGLEQSIRFAGFREDIPRVLAALDLFVMPSISEGLGTAILEAAAAGLPIVASDVGGIPDILGRNERGLLAAPGDSAALAAALMQCVMNPETGRAKGRAAAEFVRLNFSEEALAAKTEEVYRDWLGRAR